MTEERDPLIAPDGHIKSAVPVIFQDPLHGRWEEIGRVIMDWRYAREDDLLIWAHHIIKEEIPQLDLKAYRYFVDLTYERGHVTEVRVHLGFPIEG